MKMRIILFITIYLVVNFNLSFGQTYSSNPSVGNWVGCSSGNISGSGCSFTFYGGYFDLQVSNINNSSGIITFTVEPCAGTMNNCVFYLKESTSSSINAIVCGTPYPSSGATIPAGSTSFDYDFSPSFTSGTKYYSVVILVSGSVRAYTNPISITASSGSAPTVNTTNASLITINSAKLNGTVNPNGLSTAYTFQYGTSTSYGSNTTITNIGSGTSTLSEYANITGLSANTEYHYRIVATNSAGTSYGDDVTFYTLLQNFNLISPGTSSQPGVTISSLTPTFTWEDVNNATAYAIVVTDLSNNSNVISTNVGLNTSYTASTGVLQTNKNYKWQVGVNVGGNLVMSNIFYFNTNFPLPVVTTTAATNVGISTATLNGTVNPNGYSTSYSFEYGTTTSYGSATSSVNAGSGTSAQSVNASINSLQTSTTYHYRIKATNTYGTVYGSDMTFTTGTPAPTYTYSPTIGTYTNCGTGTMTLGSINYSECYSDAGTTSYTQGNVQVALISHNVSTGAMIFRFKKCSGYYTNGTSGKLFIRQGGDVFCGTYSITNTTTSYVDLSINYSSIIFYGLRDFEAFLITSAQQTYLYAGTIAITGIDPNNYINVTNPTSSTNWNTGTSYSITWSDNISENVKIRLSKGGMSVLTITSSTASNGSYSWTPPTSLATGTDYMILIESVNTYSIIGSSPYFTINGQDPYCSGTTNLTASSGGFEDGSTLNNYVNNSECYWLIQPTGASAITLTFTSFSTETSNDIVRVYDGSTTAATLLGTYSGTSIPSAITSTGGSMLVSFITDGNTTSDGWTATYTSTGTNPSLVLWSSQGFGQTNLYVGTQYNYSATIKNTGTTSWTGCFFLKQGATDWIAINSMTIAAGSSANISSTYTPSTPGSNLPVILNYQTACINTGFPVSAGNFSNPIYVNIIGTPSYCSFTDCPSSTNCGGTTYQDDTYTAVQYLCSHHIVKGINDSVYPAGKITRAQLAKITLYGVFGDSLNVPSPLVSDYFPSPYADLQTTSTYYYQAALALLYLDYGDGITPFDRDRFWFDPSGTIKRKYVMKVLLEAFNIAPSTSTASAFNDFYPGEQFYGYAKKAKELGITDATYFRPNDDCRRDEAFLLLYRLINHGLPTINNTLYPATSSFFIPFNMSIAGMGGNKGMESGNFNHYTKSCFAIPGRNVSLNFDFTYNSYLTEIPSELYPLEPLGKAWSHTYNMYLNFIYGPTVYDTKFAIHMPDGSLLIYTLDSLAYVQSGVFNFLPETMGNYNTLTNISPTKYELKTKSQVVYTFQKLGSNDIAFVLTSIKDRNNNTVTINYASGASYLVPGTTSTYKDTRKITSVTDPAGRALQFSYNSGSNLIKSITDPLGRIIQFNYANNQLSAYTDAKGQNTLYNYGTGDTASFLLKTIQLPKGSIITNQYFQRKLTNTKYNNNSPTTIVHNPNYVSGNNNFYKSTVTLPQQGTQSVVTNYELNKNGNITKMDGNNALDISTSYNTANNPTLPSDITNNLNSVTVTPTYDQYGNVTQIVTSGNGINTTETFQYNTINDITQHTDANGHTTYFSYSNGNLSQVTDALGNSTNITNNSYGHPTSVTNPSNVTVNLGYNSYGNNNSVNIPSLGLSASMNYDAASRMTSATNFGGQTTTYSYDNNDNLTLETDQQSHSTSYAYDPNDNLTGITNAKGFTTSFTYDNYTDWLLTETFQGATKTYTYNNDGSLNAFQNPNGNTLSYTYDNSGRLTSDGYASYTYLSSGNLSAITKDGKAISFGYDGLNRVNSVAYDGNTVTYTYDNVGNVLTMTYPGNKTVTYTYDAANKLKTVTDWNSQKTNYYYRPDGQLDYMVYPNGVKTTYTYDNAGRRTAMSTRRNNGSGSAVAEYTFTLDPIGNHTQEAITEQYTSYPATANHTINYNYNNANRILNAGNINFGFDNNGNTTSKTGYTYAYDVLNNLISVSGNLNATYVYDGAGNRRQATRNGVVTKYVLDILGMSNVLLETDAGGNAQNNYVYGLGLISRIKPDNTTSYYVYDYRGSTVAMVDATTSAIVTHKYQYDDFGKVLQIQEADYNPFRYLGKYGVMYEDSTLQFMRARYYDPTIGRFLSEDPIWSVNLYPYANNNPINNIDPYGLKSVSLKESLLSAIYLLRGIYDYVNSNKKDIFLSDKQFQIFTKNLKNEGNKKNVIFEDGTEGYSYLVSSQGPAGAYLGNFTLYTDKNNNIVGLYDTLDYDFKIDDAFKNKNFSNYDYTRDVSIIFAKFLILCEQITTWNKGESRNIKYGKQIAN